MLNRYVACVLALCGWFGIASADDAQPTTLAGRVTDVLGQPVEDARIYVMPRSGSRAEAETNSDGRYSVRLSGGGAYAVVIAVDKVHTYRQVLVKGGTATKLDVEVELDVAGGEVIKIIDRKLPPPAVMPKPTKDVRLSLPYSEEAMERDAWAKAWLLLDLDTTGAVTRLKLLKRPGFDLDQIAIDEAFKLRFEPARDAAGRPIRTYVVWSMEWPSWGWLAMGNGTMDRRPADDDGLHHMAKNYGGDLARANWARPAAVAFPHALSSVPCAGSGPLNLDARNRAYRDCSAPDLQNEEALPWITRETAATAIAELKAGTPAVVMRAPGSRVPETVGAVVTGGFLIATVVAFVQFNSYQERIRAAQWKLVPPEEHVANKNSAQRWQDYTILFAGALAASGATTLFLWNRHQTAASFSVQPTNGGAALSLDGSF